MIAVLVVVHAANAQTGVIWATDASVGVSHGGGGQFVYRANPVTEIAASVRKPLRHSIGLDAEVDYDWVVELNGQDLLCADRLSRRQLRAEVSRDPWAGWTRGRHVGRR